MILLFGCTLFLSSTLLFLVQPMVAKMVLPLLGGTPAVWNTCMLFFQATLLAAYLYVHAVTRWLHPARQALLHIALLVVSILALPIAIGVRAGPPSDAIPVLWLTRVLLFAVGVPFFVVSTSGPMLQHWFGRTPHPAARDPYFLSVAGNLGSVAALIAYPAGLEPRLRLAEQSGWWAGGYVVLIVMTIVCGWIALRAPAHEPTSTGERSPEPPVAVRTRLRWVGLAFVPSSLMLGLTTFLTTDVAPVPLFWVVPLALYLLSFALTFSRRAVVPHAVMLRLLPIAALVLVVVLVFATQLPPAIQMPLHAATFFVAAMVCHGELARARPTGRRLTEFYLLMSVGGVLGGAFNALVAPAAFKTVVEYPLAIVLACAARPREESSGGAAARGLDLAAPLAFGAAALVLMSALAKRPLGDPLAVVCLYIAPPLVCLSFKRRPLRFALGLAALMAAGSVYVSAHERLAFSGRSYFSVYKVVADADRHLRLLVHGRIVHGAQSTEDARRREPLTYYHRTGPIGQAFAAFEGPFAKPRVGVVGLGAGSLAAYALPGQRWTFYEIDPSIVAVARQQFSFVADMRAPAAVVVGDARLSLAQERSRAFDLLVIDAFGSDAIPIHLLTREALQLYLRTLDDGGVLAFHITNGYMDLQPLVAALGRDAGLAVLAQEEREASQAETAAGKAPSSWVLMARSVDDFGRLCGDLRWHPPAPVARLSVWTDDFSNPLGLMRWF
jgi:hypothetical protein